MNSLDWFPRSAVPLLGSLLLGVSGCGGSATEITGAVTYNGQPVEEGSVTFRPTDGKGQAFGAPIANGRFTTSKASPGSKTAVIRGVKKINYGMNSDEATRKANEAIAAGKSWAGHMSEAADYIPEDAEGNSQVLEIKSGSQEIDFAIKGPPRQ